MRQSLKDPIPELLISWELLSVAADAYMGGDFKGAEALFDEANIPILWDWLYPHWEKCHLNVIEKSPPGDSTLIAKAERHAKRFLDANDKAALLRRDGYRCRYCGIPVISPEIRKTICAIYPHVVPWDAKEPRKRHMGFQSLWLQFDHVVPHSNGGRSDLENSVVSCALCNFGKDKYTLRQLGLEDPRLRLPVPTGWDGLERLSTAKTVGLNGRGSTLTDLVPEAQPRKLALEAQPGCAGKSKHLTTIFLKGARISKGYLYTMPIQGKERWFKLGLDVQAEAATRVGDTGCLVTCSDVHLLRRGLSLEEIHTLALLAYTSVVPSEQI